MNSIQRVLKIVILIACIVLLYFSYKNDNGKILWLHSIIYFSTLLYYLIIYQKRSLLFISVLSLFFISSIFGILFFISDNKSRDYFFIFFIEAIYFAGLLLLFIRMIKDYPPKLILNKHIFLIGFVALINIIFIYKAKTIFDKYDIGLDHLLYGLIYTVIKMILMSFGIVFYIINRKKSRKILFLSWSFIAFFINDFIDTFQAMFLDNKLIPGLRIIESGLLCIGLFLFFIYTISPNINKTLEQERFV